MSSTPLEDGNRMYGLRRRLGVAEPTVFLGGLAHPLDATTEAALPKRTAIGGCQGFGAMMSVFLADPDELPSQ